MKKIEWENSNKMIFKSEHKTFNRQVKCISAGNVISSNQVSGYIRPYNETECNGRINSEGYLQNYDLEWLNKDLPEHLKKWIRGKRQGFIGYTFLYWVGKRKIFIGWIITDREHNLVKKAYARYNSKTMSALDECEKYITTGG